MKTEKTNTVESTAPVPGPVKNLNPVLATLMENLKQIKIIDEPTEPPFTKDKDGTADSREKTVTQFIQTYFPKNFSMGKGIIYSIDDSSQSIDSVLLSPSHPPLGSDQRSVIVAEGVYAAIETKPDIAKKENLLEGLLQVQSVKKLKRDLTVNGWARLGFEKRYNPYFSKIPCALFSFNSSTADKTIGYMQQCIFDGTLDKEDIPEIIFTLDHGIICHTPYFSSSGISWLKRVHEKDHPGYPMPETVFVHFNGEVAHCLALFIYFMYSFPSPEAPTYELILNKYIEKLLLVNYQIYPYTMVSPPQEN